MDASEARADIHAARHSFLTGLARAYASPLTRFFSRRVASADEVPDLVQDVFLRMSRLPKPDEIGNCESFLFVTAASVLKDRARRERVRGGGLIDPFEDHADNIPDANFTPDRVLESRQVAERIREALADLPERTRDVFVLRLLEGWKMADVARGLAISTRAAEKHQARALAHVAAKLHDCR